MKSKTSSSTVNFFSVVAGMVTTLLVLSIVFNGFAKKPVVENEIVDAEPPKGISDYDWFLTEAGDADVASFLKKLKRVNPKAALPIRIDRYRKQIAIADRLLGMETTELRRLMAIDSKVKASTQIYGLDYTNSMNLPEARKHLEALREYRDIDDDAIRREARLGLAKLSVYEYIKHRKPEDLQPAQDAVFNVIDSFPNEDYVVDTIRLIIKDLMKNDREVGRNMMRQFHENYADSDVKRIQDLALELHDALLLEEAGYQKLIINRWANGEAGKKDLLDATMKLISNPKGGAQLLLRISTTLSWFEQIHDFENAQKICEALIDAAQVHPVPEIAALTLRTGAGGISRLNMVDKKLEFRGAAINGSISPSEFDGRIVIVVFFVNDTLSTKTLQNLLRLEKEYHNKGVELLGCCMEHDIGEIVKKIVIEYPNFRCMMADESTPPTNEILGQFPVVTTPHTIVVDHNGVIKRINVQLADIRTHIDALVSARRAEQAKQEDAQ